MDETGGEGTEWLKEEGGMDGGMERQRKKRNIQSDETSEGVRDREQEGKSLSLMVDEEEEKKRRKVRDALN